jgi:hypothetical protein
LVGVKRTDFFTALVHGLKGLSETFAILGTKFSALSLIILLFASLQQFFQG